MLWRGQRESNNIIDRRGVAALGGGGLVIAVVYFLLTGDPGMLMRAGSEQNQPESARSGAEVAQEDDQKQFIGVVLADTEDVWHQVFASMDRTYEEPKLVLFRGRVSSACGMASTAVGPFYCPEDRQVYLDLSFFDELQNRLGAKGDFARAYVVAHEIGHHVQNLLGIMRRTQGARSSVAIELQADCFAGLWAQRLEATKPVLEPGDIQEALGAAAAVGDDRLQMQAQGYVVPDSFTHGTSRQRAGWFARGYSRGQLKDCNTGVGLGTVSVH